MLVCKICGKIIANVNPYKTNYSICPTCNGNDQIDKPLNKK